MSDREKEQTTSEIMLEIGSHYLCNGCNNCDFYTVSKTCDAIPLHCSWMILYKYFQGLEKKERGADDD